MPFTSRRGATAVIAAIALLAVATGTGGAAASSRARSEPLKVSKSIGYLYGGTISHGVDTLAVAANHTTTLVKETASPGGDIGGMAILHLPSGVYLYVLAGSFGGQGSVYTYAVNIRTGALTRTKAAPVPLVLAAERGNNLYPYDGFATGPGGESVLYALRCLTPACSAYGIVRYHPNPKTGALTLTAKPVSSEVDWMSLEGNRLAILTRDSHHQEGIVPGKITHSTGALSIGTFFGLVTNDNPPVPATADMVTAGPSSVGVGGIYVGGKDPGPLVAVYPSSGLHVAAGAGVDEAGTPSAMLFIPHLLLTGESSSAGGPLLQLVSPSGVTSAGSIDLTKAPYLEGDGGGSSDPNFPETIYTLGAGVYIGNYSGLIVQGTDGYAGKGFELNQTHPTVAGTTSTTSMAGFLKPSATKTTLHVKHKGGKILVSGSVTPSVGGLPVSVTLSALIGKKLKPLQHKTATLTKKGHFSASMARPKPAHCRVTASFTGDATWAPSSRTLTFPC